MSTHPLPFLSPTTQRDLDSVVRRITGNDSFASLVERCLRCDEEAVANGGQQGWRPTDPLVLRLALEVVDFLRAGSSNVRSR